MVFVRWKKNSLSIFFHGGGNQDYLPDIMVYLQVSGALQYIPDKSPDTHLIVYGIDFLYFI